MSVNFNNKILKIYNSIYLAVIKISYTKKIGITSLLILTAFISTLFFTGYSQKAYSKNSFWVKHTQEVLDTSTSISFLFQEIKTINNKNIKSKNEDVFEEKHDILKTLFVKIDQLKYLTKDNPIQQPKIEKLKNLCQEFSIFFETNKRNWDEEYDLLIRKQNSFLTGAQVLIQTIALEEKKLMVIRQKKYDNYFNALNTSFGILIGSIFILLVIIYFIIQYTQQKEENFNFKELDYQTELREQEQLQISTGKAFTSELAQYNYVMSHDLKEPLRMITGFMDLLKKGYHAQLDDKANGYINFATDGAKRMQTMINDMLKYASIGENKRRIEKVSIATLVEEAQLNLTKQIADSSAKIIIDSSQCYVRVYKAEILRLLQNLISNAIKFRKQNISCLININCVEHQTYWQVSVEDNGIGIDKFYFTRIFEIFARLHTDKEYDGTGIGLAICKKIVEQHGGNIWVESEPGEGCTFYFTIDKNL